MKKDTFYFPHDSSAKDDPKCVLLIEQLGPEGYGIFWILVEILRGQPDYTYPIGLLPALARRYNTTNEKIKAVVVSYDLFSISDDKFFFSESLNRRMREIEFKRKMLSESGKKGNAKRWELTEKEEHNRHPIATRSPGDRHPIAIKENKSKLNTNNISANALTDSASASSDFDADFNVFWDTYDKKRNREKCIKLWKKLSEKEKEEIIDYIPDYKKAQPEKQFRKDPATFITQKSWNDELIFNNEKEKDNEPYRI
ncbi:MAG: DUF4373 domain-containing protein [Odoribacter sp.]